MSDRRYFAKIDVGYLDNPKTGQYLDDRPHLILFHLRAVLYCRQHMTDGVFPVAQVARMAAASYCGSCTELCTMHSTVECTDRCDWCEAVHVGLFERIDARFGAVHDYLEHQESAQDVKDRSAARQKAARARWDARSKPPSSAPSYAPCIAPSNAPGNASEMQRRGEERYIKTLAHEAHDSAAADAATRESEPKDEPPPLLPVETETPTPKTKPSSRDLDAAFAKFWDTYPRKKSKAAGRTAYERAARKAGPAVIQAALEAQLPSLMAKDPTYRPYPATWLNAGSWDARTAAGGTCPRSGAAGPSGALRGACSAHQSWSPPTTGGPRAPSGSCTTTPPRRTGVG